jgi:hypothetical protein
MGAAGDGMGWDMGCGRGYGRSGSGCVEVLAHLTSAGDERHAARGRRRAKRGYRRGAREYVHRTGTGAGTGAGTGPR